MSKPETAPSPARKARKKKAPANVVAFTNEIEIPPEGTSEATLNQKLMRDLYEAKKEAADNRARIAALEEKMGTLVLKGARVQRGSYKPRSKAWAQRHPRYKQALIDAKGEDYQLKVLEETPPTPHFRVWIE